MLATPIFPHKWDINILGKYLITIFNNIKSIIKKPLCLILLFTEKFLINHNSNEQLKMNYAQFNSFLSSEMMKHHHWCWWHQDKFPVASSPLMCNSHCSVQNWIVIPVPSIKRNDSSDILRSVPKSISLTMTEGHQRHAKWACAEHNRTPAAILISLAVALY